LATDFEGMRLNMVEIDSVILIRTLRMVWLRTRISLLLLICIIDIPATAQEKGTTIQGRASEEVEIEIERGEDGPLLDFREQLRVFVQRISTYARSENPNFVVIAKGSPELLTKIDIIDVEKVSTARTYIRSIDGILVDGLFFGEKTVGEPTKPEKLEKILNYVRLAKKNNLNVMVMDYVKSAQQAEQSYVFNQELELTPFVANAKGEDLNSIPTFLETPYKENSKSILSMIDAKNFLYLGDSSSFGRQDEFALRIHDTNYDIVAVNIMHGRLPLSRQAVETLKYKKLGSKRLVLAHVDIGSAASHDYFWQADWREGSPSWISGPTKDNPDRHFIQYWRPEWQRIIFGDTNSYIYGLVAQGFDGVILTGLDSYKYFLGDKERDDE
jgi:endo-alpha-1,4-polygalactosaminidase (GH114 family)